MIRWRSFRVPHAWMRFGSLAMFLLFGYVLIQHQYVQNTLMSELPLMTSDSCTGYEYASNIVVSVKTGATEAHERLPTLMSTSLNCISNTIIFSDLAQDIGKYHLYDALDTVSPKTISTNPDFKFYTQQKELWKSSQNVSSLQEIATSADKSNMAAWKLDKYKFLHLLEKTWKIKPDMDWYFIIDADTYVLWPNMLHWLRTLNPGKKAYLGGEVLIDGVSFAHGGTGIILSKAAMFELVVTGNGTASKWDDKTIKKCCGDLVLGIALKEHGINVQDVWPLMSGETPFTMPFGPGTPEYWCGPVMTMHHLSPIDMLKVARFEKQRESSLQPLTHAEFFKTLLHDLILSERQDWDNLASEKGEYGKTGGIAHEMPTFEGCKEACEKDENCFQYSHHDHTCFIGMSVRVGYAKSADDKGVWRSGWHKGRLEKWLAGQPPCHEISFPSQKPQS